MTQPRKQKLRYKMSDSMKETSDYKKEVKPPKKSNHNKDNNAPKHDLESTFRSKNVM